MLNLGIEPNFFWPCHLLTYYPNTYLLYISILPYYLPTYYLNIHLPHQPPTYPHSYLPTSLPIYPSIRPFVYRSIRPPVRPSVDHYGANGERGPYLLQGDQIKDEDFGWICNTHMHIRYACKMGKLQGTTAYLKNAGTDGRVISKEPASGRNELAQDRVQWHDLCTRQCVMKGEKFIGQMSHY